MLQFPSPYKNILPGDIQIVWPPQESHDRTIRDRIVGSLVGLAVGDALGASVEFRPREYLVKHPVRDMMGGGTWGLQAGQWTDDTSMALCLASSLITHKSFNPYDQMVRYKWWYKYGYLSSTGQCFDIGGATRASLEEFSRRQNDLIRRHNWQSDIDVDQLPLDFLREVGFNVFCSEPGVAGNGALMRLAPVPLFFHRHPSLAVQYSGESARLTHGDDVAIDACRYYGALIVAALRGESKTDLLSDDFYDKHHDWFSSQPLHKTIVKIARGSFKRPNGYNDGIRGKGHIIWTLEAALWAFWSANSFEIGALDTVNLGDDTDTTAAIYGQLAGAYYGYQHIPEKWTKQLYSRELIECVAEWIQVLGGGETRVPVHQRASRSRNVPIEPIQNTIYVDSVQSNQSNDQNDKKSKSTFRNEPFKSKEKRSKSAPRLPLYRRLIEPCTGRRESKV